MDTFSEHKWGIGLCFKNTNEKRIKIHRNPQNLQNSKKMPQISTESEFSEFSEDWDFPHKWGENWLYLQDMEHDLNKIKACFTIDVKKISLKLLV